MAFRLSGRANAEQFSKKADHLRAPVDAYADSRVVEIVEFFFAQSSYIYFDHRDEGFNTPGSTKSVQFSTDAEAAVGRQHLATANRRRSQHFPRCGVHKVNLPASNAGQGFIAPVVRRNFFCREALHAEAGVWAAVDQRGIWCCAGLGRRSNSDGCGRVIPGRAQCRNRNPTFP